MKGLLAAGYFIVMVIASAWATETPVLKVESVYEVVTTWYPPFVEPARIDSTHITVTTNLLTGEVDTTGGR